MQKWGQVWDVFLKSTFLLCICILNTVRGVFDIKSLFCMVVEILCSHAFSTIRGLFFGTFLYKIILEPEKKSQKIKFENDRTLFLETFYIKDLFSIGLLAPKFRTLFPKTFLREHFWWSIWSIWKKVLRIKRPKKVQNKVLGHKVILILNKDFFRMSCWNQWKKV